MFYQIIRTSTHVSALGGQLEPLLALDRGVEVLEGLDCLQEVRGVQGVRPVTGWGGKLGSRGGAGGKVTGEMWTTLYL